MRAGWNCECGENVCAPKCGRLREIGFVFFIKKKQNGYFSVLNFKCMCVKKCVYVCTENPLI